MISHMKKPQKLSAVVILQIAGSYKEPSRMRVVERDLLVRLWKLRGRGYGAGSCYIFKTSRVIEGNFSYADRLKKPSHIFLHMMRSQTRIRSCWLF